MQMLKKLPNGWAFIYDFLGLATKTPPLNPQNIKIHIILILFITLHERLYGLQFVFARKNNKI